MRTLDGHRLVLVVEDDPEIRDSLQDALESEGYRVTTAVNGQDGLDRLREMAEPCIILLDLMMPVMSGAEFLEVLRGTGSGRNAKVPVVIVSAWPDEAAKVRLHAQGYVPKPVSLDALLDAVSSFCSDDAEAARATVAVARRETP